MSTLIPPPAAARDEKRLRLEKLLRARRARELPLSFAQQRLWFLHQLEPGSTAYNLPTALRISGDLDAAALRRALSAVVRRHEVLRTTFPARDGQPSQLVHPAAPVPLPRADLGALPDAHRERELRRLARAWAARPFDLARGPLLRALLVRLGDDEHALLFTLHHLVSDGWSTNLLAREVSALYEAFAAGREPELAPLPLQYADYAEWQRGRLSGAAGEAMLAWWRDALAGAPTLLDFPTDHPRPAEPSARGGRIAFEVAPETAAALDALARDEGCTPFMVMLAAWQALLARWSGQDDVLVGSPVAGRTRAELEGLIGFFVNTVVLRGNLSGDPTFRAFLGRVREAAVGAFERQEMPLERLVDELKVERSLSQSPLFQATFSLATLGREALSLGGLRVEPLDSGAETVQFDLNLDLARDGDALGGIVSYRAELWDAGTIEALAGHYRALLDGIAAEPDRAVGRIPILRPDERERLLRQGIGDDFAVPAIAVHELIAARATAWPDAEAVISCTSTLTYAELDARASAVAARLRARGVGPEMRVGLLLGRCAELAVAVLGVLKAGGAFVPFDPATPPERLARMLEDCGAPILLTDGTLTEIAGDTEIISLAALEAEPAPSPSPEVVVDGDSLAYAIYTSGSTGTPKGVLVSHASLVGYAEMMREHLGLARGDRMLQFASPGFDVVIEELFPIWLAGGAVIFPGVVSTSTPAELVRVLEEHRATVLELPTAFWQEWAREIGEGESRPPASVRAVLVGGERVQPDALHAWATADVELIHVFGLTETAVTSATLHVAPGEDASARWANLPVGRALPGVAMYVLDAAGEPVPGRVAGELYIGGPGVARGYGGRATLTAERYVPDPFSAIPGARMYRTGDRVRWTYDSAQVTGSRGDERTFAPSHSRTPFLEFLGRADAQGKIRGFRIEPGEIEAALADHPAVAQAAVIAREDEGGRKRLVAYVAPAAGWRAGATGGALERIRGDTAASHGSPDQGRAETRALREAEEVDWTGVHDDDFVDAVDADALRDHLRGRLPEYMLPSAFVALPALPLSPNGKVDRRALPAPPAAPDDEAHHEPPRDAAERTLAEVWAGVLKRERIGVHDNFFELGGDSILSIQVVSRARKAGLVLTPRQIFEHPTLAALAGAATPVEADTFAASPARVPDGPLPLAPIQRWFFARELPRRHHWNLSVLLEPAEPVDAAALEAAIRALVGHHDALRLCFTEAEDGRWTQTYASASTEPVLDRVLCAVADDELEATVERACAEAQASLDFGGPLFRARLIERGAERGQRLLLVCHHLVVDGVSWRVLLEDLETAYAQAARGEPIELPPATTSYGEWAMRLDAHTRAGAFDGEIAWWTAQAGGAPLPIDHPHAPNTPDTARSIDAALDAEDTEALLREVPPAYRTRIDDALLFALARAFAAWTGEAALRVELEGHGREELFAGVDLSRTVGWFTTQYPVRIDAAGEVRDAIRRVKEQLRAVPGRGIGYGALRHLHPSDEVRRALDVIAEPQVHFEYLGQIDSGASAAESRFRLSGDAEGPQVAPGGERAHLISIAAGVVDGCLRASFSYGAALHDHETIERLAASFAAELRALIAHCREADAGGCTPSDFPLASLTQEALDALLGGERGVEDVYPLTPMQEGMLFHTLYQRGSGAYVAQSRIELAGALDVDAFARAWDALLERHAALRASFVFPEGGGEPLQVVRRRVAIPLHREDWRGLPPRERTERLRAYLAGDRARGFDPARPPLMRLALFRTADEAHHLVWSFHQMVLDGWSLPLIYRDVLALYEAFTRGRAPRLAAPPPFRGYVEWLRRRDAAESERFWREMLRGIESPTSFGVDRRGGEPGFGAESMRLEEEPSAAIAALARAHGLTGNTVVLGAWAILLARYGGVDDVVFGTTVSGRPAELEGVEEMVGLFINTLPLRVSVDASAAVVPWLTSLQRRQIELREHEHTPLAQVRRWSEVAAGEPLFESIVAFENYPVGQVMGDPGDGPALRARLVAGEEQNNFPLTLIVRPGERLDLEVRYDRARFGDAVARRILRHLRTLLRAMAAAPDAPLAALSPLSDVERRQLEVWNDTRRDYAAIPAPAANGVSPSKSAQADCVSFVAASSLAYPQTPHPHRHPHRHPHPEAPRHANPYASDATLHALIAAQAARTPDAEAVAFEGERITYREMEMRAERLAADLRARGVGPETLVGICAERSLEMVIGLLAILEAGGAYVPLDPGYPAERLAYMLEDSAVRVLLTQERLIPNLPPHTAEVVLLDDVAEPADGDGSHGGYGGHGDSLAYMIYTSGSTGRPKGALNTHRGIVNRLLWMQETYGLSPGDRVLQKTPFSFDVSVWELFWPLITGATLVMARSEGHRDGAYLAGVVRREGITTLHFVPSMLPLFLDAPGVERCHSLRRVICSGEALGGELARRFLARLPRAELHNLYGPTEAAVDVTFHPCRADDGRAAMPIGRPVANTQIHLLDARGEQVPVGVPGELYIGGVQVGRGYWRRPALTAERFVPDPFSAVPGARLYRTGDRARRLEDGELDYLGRLDFQVKVRGFRVELGEVESALAMHPSVRDCAAAVLDGDGDARLVAWIVPAAGAAVGVDARAAAGSVPAAGTLDFDALRDHLRARLPEPMVPSAFVSLDALPITPNGKLDRRALPAPDAPAPSTGYVAPRTEIEAVIAGIWASVLGIDRPGHGGAEGQRGEDEVHHRRVGVHDGFFALGGHSLTAARVVARLREVFGVEMAVRALFESPTVAELAAAVEAAMRGGDGPAPPIIPISRDEELPLSFGQLRLWLFDQLHPGSDAYNLPGALRLEGELDVRALASALTEVVRRHEALRTTFREVGRHPVQEISPPAPVPLPIADLSPLPSAMREREARRLARDEARRPFDLARGPLLRVRLLRMAAGEHVLLYTLHHIAGDAWSSEVMVREVSALYAAFRDARLAPNHPGLAGPDEQSAKADFVPFQRRVSNPPNARAHTSAGRSSTTPSGESAKADFGPLLPRFQPPVPQPAGTLPRLPVQYADYAAWQRAWLSGDVLARHVEAWRRRLEGAPAAIALRTDHPRPPTPAYRGQVRIADLPADAVAAVEARACGESATLYMALLAAWAVLLHRLTGEREMVIGTPTANRGRAELEGLIGFFVNLLPMRVDLSANPTFAQLLRQVRETSLDALAHQELPFEEIVNALQIERVPGRPPLAQVAFALQNVPDADDELAGLRATPFVCASETARFELELAVRQGGGVTRAALTYDTDLFDASTADALLGGYASILEQLAAGFDRRVLDITLGDEVEAVSEPEFAF